MLLDAALRSACRARSYWQSHEDQAAAESILRAEAVMTELLAGLDLKSGSELASRLAAVYAFVHRTLVEAVRRRDEQKLAEAIRILEIERETWRQLCDKLRGDPKAGYVRIDSAAAASTPVPLAEPPALLSEGSFSLEA
jgi:flagellar protein FliS